MKLEGQSPKRSASYTDTMIDGYKRFAYRTRKTKGGDSDVERITGCFSSQNELNWKQKMASKKNKIVSLLEKGLITHEKGLWSSV